MNRPGQPQQRPPNLTPNPALAGQFRPSYPPYGLPPRTVLQSPGTYVPSLQPTTHRTATQPSQAQSLTPQPTPGAFNQARSSPSSYAFGGGLGQHPPSSVLGLPSQQQQPNGTQSAMSSLLVQPSSLGVAPPASSNSDVGLDPNDFPALGSATTNPNANNTSNGPGAGTTSYASQAGTGVLLGGGAGSSGGSVGSSTVHQTRDFTPDDFPALGGGSAVQAQTTQQQSREGSSATTGGSQDGVLSHPPGLNGFQSSEQHQLRQNVLGPHASGLPQATPGMLNLGSTHRNVHPGFQSQTEPEKQQSRQPNYSLKLNAVGHAAWGSSNANATQPQQSGGAPGANGTFLQTQQPLAVSVTNSTAPPTSGAPFSSNGLSADLHQNSSIPNAPSNPIATSNNANMTSLQTTAAPQLQYPQTPAQQVLISAADRWGLLSLVAYMRNASSDVDHGLSSIGTDLGTMGLDMAYSGNLYSTFITPWADQSAARTVEPDFHIPQCYQNVHAPSPGPAKTSMFSDETLFFMFYSTPRDALQEVAAQELWNRNWRFHKELRLWITKESGTSPSQKVQGGLGELGKYTCWDPENWAKEQKEMTVLYNDLEEKSVPAYLPGSGLVLAPSATQPQTVSQQQAQLTTQPSLPTRATFQMALAGL